MSILNNIKIVLVETSHTGNMGSAARAMKTMGLTNLCLVNPVIKPDSQAISLAAGASDIIKNAQIYPTVEQAVADCELVIGTSARSRSLQWPHLDSTESGKVIVSYALNHQQVALVFGRERVGLTNEELQKCDYHVSIPANPEYSSLNLAMSVQIFCYEIRMAMLAAESTIQAQKETTEYPKNDDLERFYQHLNTTLVKTGFINPNHQGQIMGRLRRLYARARVEKQELNILRGILTSIDKNLKDHN
ncbi:tRNA (cytosine(32)/uridine(32)-2'-O)-methyltransferase TrmJ [Orbaceae bacterium ac157xtp]